MPDEKNRVYEQYREYFTSISEGVHPGAGLFILMHQGLVSWLTLEEYPAAPGSCLTGSMEMERNRDELVNLLATIAIGGKDKWI